MREALDALDAPTAAQRRKAARTIAEVAEHAAADLATEVPALVDGLADENTQVRVSLSYALFELGIENPAVIRPVAAELIDALDDPSATVRTNLGRPIGDVLTRWPDAVSPANYQILVDRLCTDAADGARHSYAWALETVAFQHPDFIATHYPKRRAVTDGHPPVEKHACRTLAHVERHTPGWARDVTDEIRHRVDADEAALRVAATIALGAIGTPHALSALETARRTDDDARVQRAAEHAIREATYPQGLDATVGDPVTRPGRGAFTATCLSVRSADATRPRGGRYRGSLAAHAEHLPAWADDLEHDGDARLVNPAEGYAVSLSVAQGNVTGRYRDIRTSDYLAFDVADILAIPVDVLPLGYALEDDTLSFNLGPSSYDGTVTHAGESDGQYRVVVDDSTRGSTVIFRPRSHDPLVGILDGGRGFDVTDIRVTRATGSPIP